MENLALVVVASQKNIQAIINYASEKNIDLEVLKGAWKTNLTVRPEKIGKI